MDNNQPSMSMSEMKIINFLNSSDDILKTEHMYSIDSAIWYAGMALNYTYSIYDSSFVYVRRDTFSFSVDLDQNNLVAYSDLVDLIDQMTDSLSVEYDDIQDNIKHLFYCAVKEEIATAGTLNLKMISNFGCGWNGLIYAPFGNEDYWWSSDLQGKCNNLVGDGDAAVEIMMAIMQPATICTNPRVRKVGNPLYSVVLLNAYDYPYPGSPTGYRAFYRYGVSAEDPWDGYTCLSPTDMNFYVSSNGVYYIIDAENIYNMDFIDISILGSLLWGPIGEWWEEAHWMDINYGEVFQTGVPAGTL